MGNKIRKTSDQSDIWAKLIMKKITMPNCKIVCGQSKTNVNVRRLHEFCVSFFSMMKRACEWKFEKSLSSDNKRGKNECINKSVEQKSDLNENANLTLLVLLIFHFDFFTSSEFSSVFLCILLHEKLFKIFATSKKALLAKSLFKINFLKYYKASFFSHLALSHSINY